MSIFAGVRCKRDAVILESNWKKTASLNVTHLQIRKLYGHWIKWPVSWNYGSFLILVTEGVEGCISQCSRKDQEWIAQVERFSDNYSVENYPSQQKTDYILCVHRVLSFTELNLGLSKKMWSDYRGMMQEWLHGCTILGENRISAEKLRTKMEEHEEEVFTGYKSAMVWSSRKNGRKYLVYWMQNFQGQQ